jgi:hypothetical protein
VCITFYLKNKKVIQLNCIKKRLRRKLIIASLQEDLKKFNQFKKYFTTENEDENNSYKEMAYDEFYVYQDPSLGIENPIFGMCQCVCMRRKGYDDPVSLAGLYKVDDNGNVVGAMIGYDKVEGSISELRKKIKDNGIKGYGKLFLVGDEFYKNFDKIKDYAEQQIKNKSENLIQK